MSTCQISLQSSLAPCFSSVVQFISLCPPLISSMGICGLRRKKKHWSDSSSQCLSKLLAHNHNSSFHGVHCLLLRSLSPLITHLWDPVPVSEWLHRLTHQPSDEPLWCSVLKSFISSNSSDGHLCVSSTSSLTITSHGTHQELTWGLCLTSSCPLTASSATSYCWTPLTSPFTFGAEMEPLPLVCSHECPVHPQALRPLPCQPPSLLGHLLEKSWSLVDQVQGPGKLVNFSMAPNNARKASYTSLVDSLWSLLMLLFQIPPQL